jgi:phosphotriesterase-related protein
MIRLFVSIKLVLLLVSVSLSNAQIITVNGPIEANEMGLSLIHEHIIVDWIGADSTGYHRWDKNKVVDRALPYLKEAKKHGVQTFLACTPAYLGRDPFVLKELSNKTGVNILTNTGYYGVRNNKFVPKYAFEASAKEISDNWLKEHKNGIDGSNIKPGFIKISVEREDELSDMHEKLIRAAALTHLESGLTIVSHTGTDGPAMAQIKVLKEMGVSPEAFVWTHAQHGTMEGYLKAAKEGAWLSIDNIKDRDDRIAWFLKTLTELKENQILDHVLISHDAGWYDVGEPNGGDYRGYTALFTRLIPELKKNGFTQKDIDLLLIDNPKRAYALKVREL